MYCLGIFKIEGWFEVVESSHIVTTAANIASFDLLEYRDSAGREYRAEYVQIQKTASTRSVLFDYGIRLKKISNESTQLFICCVPGCNSYFAPIKHPSSSTKSATTHLKLRHAVISTIRQTKQTSIAAIDNTSEDSKKALYGTDHRRYSAVAVAKFCTIAESQPMEFVDTPNQKFCWNLVTVPEFPRDLNSELLEVCLVEIYAAVKARLKKDVEEAKTLYLNLPFVYLSVHLWKSQRWKSNILESKYILR